MSDIPMGEFMRQVLGPRRETPPEIQAGDAATDLILSTVKRNLADQGIDPKTLRQGLMCGTSRKMVADAILKCIPHDRAERAEAALAEARAEIEKLIWNLGGISTIACARNLDHYSPGQEWERPALSDTAKLVEDYKRLLEALEEIASRKEGETVDASFDEPWSASRAREALAPGKEVGHE